MLIPKLNYNSMQLAPLEDTPTRERSLVPANPQTTSELELKELVRLAQSYNQEAIDELYNRFKGLIINEIKASYVRDALGEDAENIAWEIFYNAVQEVDVDETRCIPFILKRRVHSRLINEVKQLAAPWLFDSLEASEEKGIQIESENDSLREYISNSCFDAELKKFSPKGQDLLKKVYFDGYSLTEYAQSVNQDYDTIQKLHKRCLKRMQDNLRYQ